VDWIGLAQDRNRCRAVVNLVLNPRVAWNAGKLSSGLTSSGLSSSAQLHRVSYLVREFGLCSTHEGNKNRQSSFGHKRSSWHILEEDCCVVLM
jgi:hypothetical protein